MTMTNEERLQAWEAERMMLDALLMDAGLIADRMVELRPDDEYTRKTWGDREYSAKVYHVGAMRHLRWRIAEARRELKSIGE